jgi:hypothetical protein
MTTETSALEHEYQRSIVGLEPETVSQIEDLTQPLRTDDQQLIIARTLYTRLASTRRPMYPVDVATCGDSQGEPDTTFHVRV